MSHDPTILLDDGEYRLWTHNERRQDMATGVLERRCLVSPSTPSGRAVIGSFTMLPDGSWCAQVAAPRNPRNDVGCTLVAAGVARNDAIVALWQARHDAYLAQHCL